MQGAAAGDKEAFRRLAHSLGHKMYATAVKLIGTHYSHEAEDAVQISLIKLWQNAPNWADRGSVEGYVYRIVFSTCMDLHRSRKNSEELKENSSITKTNAHDDLIHHELRGILMKAIQKLPKMQQQAILLHYFSGYTQNEVADMIGKSEKATESLIIRARKKLQNVLPQELKEGLFYA